MNKIQVTQSSMPEFDDYINEIKDIWESRWLTNNGKKHELLEEKLQDYLEVDNVTLMSNGHMALYLGIKMLDLKGEVITTPFTFASTTHAIVQNGLKPVFCDINEEDYTIDVSKIESLITENTCAIVPVHVYGNICNVEEIEKIAKKYNLKVIYDAAHGFGVKYNDKTIGQFGDISMFSFHATKVFNTIEGGALVYKADEFKNKLNMLKNFGITGPETVEAIGMNSKMNEFQAAMGLCNLKNVDEEIYKREKVVERYISNLKNEKGIILWHPQNNVKHNFAYLPILVVKNEYGINRDELCDVLSANEIFARKYFYPLVSDYSCYKGEYDSNETPIAKKIANQILTLPLYANLTMDEIDKICNVIKNKK